MEYQHYVTAYLEKLLSLSTFKPALKTKLKPSCSVCDDLTCRRHQVGQSVVPWKDIKIREELNDAIEHVSLITYFLN